MEHSLQTLFKSRHSLVFLVLFVTGFILYSGALKGEFCSDDFNVIVENPYIKDLGNLYHIWGAFKTRFVGGVTFALNYAFGQMNTFGYHAFNVVVHIAVSFCVYLLASFIYTWYYRPQGESGLPFFLAVFAALIFLAHPLQTESTAYITQRFTSLAALFYLAAICFYIRFALQGRKECYACALLCMGVGCLTKESVASLPAALLVCEICFLGLTRTNARERIKRLLPFCALSACVPYIWMVDRSSTVFGLGSEVGLHAFSWRHFLTQINIFATNLRLLFVPVNLNHSYDYPVVQSLFDIKLAFSLMLMAAVITTAFMTFSKKRVIAFSIMWYFATTCVESVAVSFGVRGIIYEHWLYLAVAGFAIFVPFILVEWLNHKKKLTAVLSCIVLILSVLTLSRVQVWQFCDRLWLDSLRKSPYDHIPLINLGVYYSRRGDADKAIAYFEQALKLNRIFDDYRLSQLYTNIAAAYGRKEDYDKEIEYSVRALQYFPDNELAYNNIAVAHAAMGRLSLALPYAKKAIELYPDYADGYNNLGMIYGQMGKYNEARHSFLKALELEPDNSTARKNLGLVNKLMNKNKR